MSKHQPADLAALSKDSTKIPALAVRTLTVRRGRRDVLRNVTFTVQPGERIAIIGSNGSGKTTLLRTIAGLLRPRTGNVHINGVPATSSDSGIRKTVGFLGHRPHLYPYLTARENLQIQARLFGVQNPDLRIDTTLSTVGLATSADRPVREFSRGMQQRLGLGLAMLHSPSVLLLDEPDAGLDPEAIENLPEMISRLCPHSAVMFSTHDERVVTALADQVGRVAQGRVSLPNQDVKETEPSLAREWPDQIGFVAATTTLIVKDIRTEWRAREQVPTLLIFTLLIALVFDMAFIAIIESEAAAVATGLLWTSVLLAATLGGTKLFAAEQERGTLDGLLLAPIDPSSIYVAKFCVLSIETFLVGAMQLGFISLLLNVPLLQGATIGVLALSTTAISAVIALHSSLIINARARELLMPLLSIPIAIPVVLAGVGATLATLEVTPAAQQWPWFGLLAITTAVFLSVGVVLYPYTTK